MNILIAITLIPAALLAQPPVAPTPETVGSPRGENIGGYNIVNSFEIGYRLRLVDGNLGEYRSEVNYGNGLRLLSSGLRIDSKDGHGGLFDQIILNTQGLGNDPYQVASLHIEKNGLYRYDLIWRLNQYYNPALNISYGQHLMDTSRRIQDHDLTLFPQSKIRFMLGYSRNNQDGPALSTVQEFGSRQNEFPIFSNIRRQDNEYRVGGDAQIFGAKFTWLHAWDDFKEDTPYQLNGGSLGNVPSSGITLTSFARTQPYHGTSPYWRLGLLKERKLWAVNARYSYVAGRRNFAFNEIALGANRFGPLSRQILVAGDANRPISNGNLTFTLFPTSYITITNQTAFQNTRITGDSTYNEFDNGATSGTSISFQLLGIRTITNLFDVNIRVRKWLGVYTGYDYSDRRIGSNEGFSVPGLVVNNPIYQTNITHAGLLGIRINPIKPLTLNVEGEVDRANRPFYPISDRNYHSLGWRAQYKVKSLLLSASTHSKYNTNSSSVFEYSSRARNYSVNAAWTLRQWFGLDAGYSKLHVDSVSGIAYFANFQSVDGERSIFISNIHAVNVGARIGIGKRADLYLGYNRVQDLGDGRATVGGDGAGSALPALQAAQTFPLSFESPLARLSVRLSNKVRWNFGYQYYRYGEKFYTNQNYRANTGYSSVLWSF